VVFGILSLLAIGGWLWMQQFARERFVLSETSIERVSPWTGKRKGIRWIAVRALNFDEYNRFILSDGMANLAIGHRIDGIGEFADVALRQLPEGVLRDSGDVKAMLEEVAARLQTSVTSSGAGGPA
jgi:hypothetical protein